MEKGGGGSILLSTTYGDRRNVVLRLSLAALAGPDALAYFQSALAERHEEASDGLDFFIRLPAPGSITGVAEIRVDTAADLRSLKCVLCSSRQLARTLTGLLPAAPGPAQMRNHFLVHGFPGSRWARPSHAHTHSWPLFLPLHPPPTHPLTLFAQAI